MATERVYHPETCEPFDVPSFRAEHLRLNEGWTATPWRREPEPEPAVRETGRGRGRRRQEPLEDVVVDEVEAVPAPVVEADAPEVEEDEA